MKDQAVGHGWRHREGVEQQIGAGWLQTEASVSGTSGRDFIHRAGDGLVAPPGYTDIAEATTGDDVIDGGKGNDIIYGDAGNDVIIGGGGSDRLYGGGGRDEFRVTEAAQISGKHEYLDGGDDGGYLTLQCTGEVDLTRSVLAAVDSLLAGVTDETSLDVLVTGEQFAGFTNFLGGTRSTTISISTMVHSDGPSNGVSGISHISCSEDNDFLHLSGDISSDTLGLAGGGGMMTYPSGLMEKRGMEHTDCSL